MPGFLTPVDIANRALQHCGVELMSLTDGFAEESDRAAQTGFVYDKLRRAELRRNTWRFAIKYAVIRPMVRPGDVDASSNPLKPTMLMSPTLWASTTTYFIGSVVMDEMGYFWVSTAPDNLNNQPSTSTYWDSYYGAVAVQPYDTTGQTVYFAGDVVYVTTGDGVFTTYLSRQNNNSSVPGTVDAFSSTAVYMKDSLVSSSSVTYQSLFDVNIGNTPSAANAPSIWDATTTYAAAALVRGSDGYVYTSTSAGNYGNDPITDGVNWTLGILAAWAVGSDITRTSSADEWMVLGVVLAQPPLNGPVGVGPNVSGHQRTVYRLPANFLRLAPQDPKAGSSSFLGAPSASAYLDWDLAGQYLVTRSITPIVLRFVADVTNVREMDDMFCEGLGARIGHAVAPKLTQSVSKQTDIAKSYDVFMSEARLVNGIETGPTEPPEDDYISCRA